MIAVVGLVVLLVVFACWPTSVDLHQRWTAWEETTYTHGWLVAAVFVFLLWRNRHALQTGDRRGRPTALLLLAAAGLSWVVAVRAGLAGAQHLLYPLLLWLAVWAAAGAVAARRNAFAAGYLYFAMPLWGSVNFLFLWMTVMVVRALLSLAGIPVYFDGNFVQVPAGVFEIAGGCSGLHFVIVGLALGALMGEVRDDDWRNRLKLLVVAGTLAVVTNWVRVFTIILAGHYSDMQHYLVVKSHYGYGWALFAVAMAGFFWYERRLPPPRALRVTDGAASIPWSVRIPQALTVVLILAVIAGLQMLSARPAARPAASGAGAPADTSPREWQPSVQGADLHFVDKGNFTGGPVERHQYVFLSQKQGKEIGAYDEDPLGGDSAENSRAAHLGRVPVMLHETRGSKDGRWLVATSYRTGAHPYPTALPAKVRYAWQSLLHLRSVPATLTVWRAPCIPDCPAAEEALEAFVTTTEGKE